MSHVSWYLSISDHNSISCTSSIKLPKPEPKGHTEISFRSFKHFNQNAFFADLTCTPFDSVHQHTDPNEALAVWYKLFMDVVNRHATIRHKRVKHSILPLWLNKNIIQATSERDRLKKERMFTEYKTARNKVNILVRNIYILGNLWKTTKIYHQFGALWTLSLKGPTLDRKKITHHFTADAFNDYSFCPLQKP